MPRSTILLMFTVAAVAAGSLALQLESRAQGPAGPLLATSAVRRPAPAWTNQSWLNTAAPLELNALRGKVVLLNFWVFTCSNCTNTVPSLVNFHHRYRDEGLVLIGIHTPEFPPYAGEHDRANVARALRHFGIEYPNAQDNDSRTWKLYGIRYWPSFVLIDKRGLICYEGAGEFHLNDSTYSMWDRRIRELLAE
jgi:thiol-disulfide isomerase/thioredoxin